MFKIRKNLVSISPVEKSPEAAVQRCSAENLQNKQERPPELESLFNLVH